MFATLAKALLGLVLRHLLTGAAGAIASTGIKIVGNLPQIEDIKTVLTGAAVGAVGLLASGIKNVKQAKLETKSGPIYDEVNR